MQSANIVELFDDTPLRQLSSSPLGSVLTQGEMSAYPVVIKRIAGKDPTEMPGAQDDHLIQALSPGYRKPITLEDHQGSRWIAEPCIHLLDCCQETDGSVAVVLTGPDRARDLPHPPVLIGAAGGAALFEQEVASDHYRGDLAVMEGCASLGRRLFDGFGYKRDDIDVALIYDAFSPILLMQLEALGFCGFGEAKDFIADGNLALDGTLPCNTHGGLIGEGYIHGLNLVLEGTKQLRGTAINQVPGARNVLLSASRTGAILTRS